MVGLGCDNAKVNVGVDNGIAALLKKNYCPYLKLNGCSAHLLTLTIKHAFDEYRTLEAFDEHIKAIYKFFSKSPSRLLDLQKWFQFKGIKYHKLLTIFDIRWLSRFHSVSNYRSNLPAILDTLLKTSKDFTKHQKLRENSLILYKETTKFESIFLAYGLSDFLGSCKCISKIFQDSNLKLYAIYQTIQDLLKILSEAYGETKANISGPYYLEFQNLLEI